MNRPLLSSQPPVDSLAAAIAADLIADLRSQLDYAALRLQVALESADQAHAASDQAHAKLAEHLRLVPFVDPTPTPAVAPTPTDPIWHALRAPAVQRIGVLVGFG